jgi:hypothetical protein
MKRLLILLGVFVFCSASAEDCKDKKAVALTQDLKDAHELCLKHQSSNGLVFTGNGTAISNSSSSYEKAFRNCEQIDATYYGAKTADEKARIDALLKDHPEWLE